VKTIHDNIETIKRILAPEFPELIALLHPGATEAQIAHAEAVTGRPLPEDFKALYRIHNGESDLSGLFIGTIFMDLEWVEREWQNWEELSHDETLWELDTDCLSVPHGWIQERYACPGWIPFATGYDGNFLGIDLAPGPEGISGQVINFGRDEETKYVIAPTLTLFFEFFVAVLESGNFRAGDDHELLLKSPTDTLKEALPAYSRHLPFGATLALDPAVVTPEIPYKAWYASLDPDWQEIVSGYVGPPESAYEDLADVTALDILNETISDIRPLARFTALRKLILSGTQVADVSPLRACRLLKILYLSNTRVTNLSPLSELTNLADLSLYRTEVTDLSPLFHLKKLTTISLERTNQIDLSQLPQLSRLTSLDISNNTFASFAPLAQLRRLKTLDLSHTNFSDLTLLTSLRALIKLGIADTPITDFSPLASLPKLAEVTCNIDAFLLIKDIVKHPIDFTMSGGMTSQQEQIWRDYMERSR
jgi:internalin A